ncbi:hypothetical protein MMC16_005838 [Acarospora aff. strigata]|nr:hypothetical protein [Acarospora aff. strigata]
MPDIRTPQNRKERRAQTRTQSTIPLSQPPRSHPSSTSTTNAKTKTLYEIGAERQQALLQSPSSVPLDPKSTTHTTLKINSDGTLTTVSPSSQDGPSTTLSNSDGDDKDDDPIGPVGNAIFLAMTLSMLHFTLDVLVHHQYRQEIAWAEIGWRTAGAFPLLTLLSLLPHHLPFRSSSPSHPKPHPSRLHNPIFLLLSLLSGTYLLHIANVSTYYAVMKRAPAIGTLWVWSVVEMELKWAVAGVVGVLGWGVGWMGYEVW